MAYRDTNISKNKREHKRLDTVFPIEFQVIGKEKREPISELKEGFTRNIGKGGMGIFAKTLKAHDKELFNFAPHETKLKLIINVPLDDEPVESYATVEWVERQPGPILDTYFFGVSYDLINEIEYEKIVDYAKWLHLKPRLILLTVATLSFALICALVLLIHLNIKKNQSEKKLIMSTTENRQAINRKTEAEKNRVKAEDALKEAVIKQTAAEGQLKQIEDERESWKKKAQSSEKDKGYLQQTLDEITEEKAVLESEPEKEPVAVSTEEDEAPLAVATNIDTIPSDRLKAEENNYRQFKGLVLDGKIQPLSAYVSSHRGSLYHAAGLFALAEIRYKAGDRSLAEANYTQIIQLYMESKYALYSGHRLDQLRRNYNYERYSLQDLYNTYRLPELFDYRNIEPYYRR